MSSGFQGKTDFYSSAGSSGGSAAINNGRVQYRSQLGGVLVDGSSPMILSRQTDMLAKRSMAEQQHHYLGADVFLRSVKQRTNHYLSPNFPVDFSSPDLSAAASTLTGRCRVPLLQHLRPQSINNQNNFPSLSGFSLSNFVPNNLAGLVESEPNPEKKMRNWLQELEKQLLDDNDEDEGDAASAFTSSEWSETVQNLIIPNQKPLSPSTTSSLSSSSSSSASPSFYSSCSKQSLLDAAAAISEGKMDAATATLARLKQGSNARGDPEQRLMAYMVSALCSRMNPGENPPPAADLVGTEHMIATQMLYEASPCFKLGFMAANLAILEATRDQPNSIHVVDFEIGQGNQYITLIQDLADRNSGKPTVVKITSVTEPGNDLHDNELRLVEDRLRKIAGKVGVGLKFNVVSRKISDVDRATLGCNADEALAVNFAFWLYKMPDESVSTENPRDQLLRLVKNLAPRVVTLVEQEMNTNTAPFLARVADAGAHYHALFDSLDATMTRNGSERVRVEECLARKASNSMACEGRDRVERCEVFGKWRARMKMAGFEPIPLGQQVAESMRTKLSTGFTVKEENGGIWLGWMGRVLTVASAWR